LTQIDDGFAGFIVAKKSVRLQWPQCASAQQQG
jgi:hypothetical protein